MTGGPVETAAERDLMLVIVEGLAAHARGEAVDEDAMQEACSLVAAAQLVHAGMPLDSVLAQFRDREHTYKVAYDRETDDLTIDVVWLEEDNDDE